MPDQAWPTRRLGNLATWMSGGTPSTDNAGYWGGDIPWISAASLRDFNIENSDRSLTALGAAHGTRLAPAGSTIFVVRGMSLKSEFRVGIAQRTVAFGQDCKALVPVDGIDPRYLAWAVKASTPKILTMVDEAGHGTGRLETRLVSNHEIGVPPLVEQRRIAEILDAVDERIMTGKSSISKAKLVERAIAEDVLVQTYSGSSGWDLRPLTELIELPSGQVDPRQAPYPSWTLIAPDHIERETGSLIARETAEAQGAISGKYTFMPGDVVYSKIRPYLRKATLVNFRGLCSADMYPMHSLGELDPRFLLMIVLGEHFSRFAESVSMRSGFPKINREELSGYSIRVPPLEFQMKAATAFDVAAKRTTALRHEVNKLGNIKSALMDNLLTGRVRVPVGAEG